MQVRWHAAGRDLLLCVCDGGGDTVPARVVAGPDQPGGRGLAIVEALSAAWWVEHDRGSYAVQVRLTVA